MIVMRKTIQAGHTKTNGRNDRRRMTAKYAFTVCAHVWLKRGEESGGSDMKGYIQSGFE